MIIDGYVYYKARAAKGTVYWQCKRYKSKECTGTAVTIGMDQNVTVLKGPQNSQHSHPPSQEECEAEKIKMGVKRAAT